MTGIVHLVGCGPGGASWVLPLAHRVVAGCDVVFGPSDLQELFPSTTSVRADLPARPEVAAPLVRAALERDLSSAVLVRGDCGLRSLARGLERLLPPGCCRRVPGISSVQAACAAFGLDWDRARVLSAHGCEPEEIDDSIRAAPLVVLLGGGDGFGAVVERTAVAYGAARIHLASNLTLPDERLLAVDRGGCVPLDLPSRTVAILRKEST